MLIISDNLNTVFRLDMDFLFALPSCYNLDYCRVMNLMPLAFLYQLWSEVYNVYTPILQLCIVSRVWSLVLKIVCSILDCWTQTRMTAMLSLMVTSVDKNRSAHHLSLPLPSASSAGAGTGAVCFQLSTRIRCRPSCALPTTFSADRMYVSSPSATAYTRKVVKYNCSPSPRKRYMVTLL